MQISFVNFTTPLQGFNYYSSGNVNCKKYSGLMPLSKDTISFEGHNSKSDNYTIKNKLIQSQNEYFGLKDIKAIKKKYNNGNLTEELILNTLKDLYHQYRQIGDYAVKYEDKNFDNNFKVMYKYATNNSERSSRNIEYPKVGQSAMGGYIYRECWDDDLYYFVPMSKQNERMSLNVKADIDLIKKLDKFMCENTYIDKNNKERHVDALFEYKIAEKPENWIKRQDPITLYFKSEINDDVINAIRDISEPYKRGVLNNSQKVKNYNWISIETVPTTKDIEKLYNRFEAAGSVVIGAINKNIKDRYTLTSTGLYRAASTMMDELEILNNANF